jgi:8-oxo-dGTP pyrophosphatase MutT (NUDIX family)
LSVTLEQLDQLPSPFYRVAAKALIMDDRQRLLVAFNSDGHYEIPGGGWEHDETLEECLKRELVEELGVKPVDIGPIEFIYRGESTHGWKVLRIVVRAKLETRMFRPGDDMTATKFVTKEEFPGLDLVIDDVDIKQFTDHIWS